MCWTAVDVQLSGQDAVIDALGGRKTPWKVTTMETSAAHNIDAMRRNGGCRRLLKISVVGAGESIKNPGFFNEHVLMRTFLRGLLVDKAGMEAGLKQQLGLDARAAADVDRPREDRGRQGAQPGERREGAQDRARRSGSLIVQHLESGLYVVGRDSDDRVARPGRG